MTHDSPSWSVLVCDGLAEPGLARLRQESEVILDDRASLGRVDAWIVRGRSQVDAAALRSAAPRLRVVGRAGVGVDNIDVGAARELGISIVTAPEASTTSVAELTIGLMLALARDISAADAALRRGEWPKASLIGEELEGKTLGLVGFGRIGRAVAARAKAFGMVLAAFDPFLDDDAIRAAGASPVTLETLLAVSDYVSLHLPLTTETRGLLGRTAIGRMKSGARLVCAARGGLIDEAALRQALDDGRLAGAALDVFAQEPPGDLALLRHPRVVATPHLGAQTVEAQARVALEIVYNVLAALRGEVPPGRVA
ncbi:MAG TPA: hydroxyacid dehydrogenase [Anaerolineales bacterium]|nr:hydroxyacid dehydrogenase [Anaerolineales bacterium]